MRPSHSNFLIRTFVERATGAFEADSGVTSRHVTTCSTHPSRHPKWRGKSAGTGRAVKKER